MLKFSELSSATVPSGSKCSFWVPEIIWFNWSILIWDWNFFFFTPERVDDLYISYSGQWQMLFSPFSSSCRRLHQQRQKLQTASSQEASSDSWSIRMKNRTLLLCSNSAGCPAWPNNLELLESLYQPSQNLWRKKICTVKMILPLSCLLCVFVQHLLGQCLFFFLLCLVMGIFPPSKWNADC